MKTQKGITLIALIITIIVMLILVGVSVSVALNTGLFKSAQGVAKNTQLAADAENTLSTGMITIKDENGENKLVDINTYFTGTVEDPDSGENPGDEDEIIYLVDDPEDATHILEFDEVKYALNANTTWANLSAACETGNLTIPMSGAEYNGKLLLKLYNDTTYNVTYYNPANGGNGSETILSAGATTFYLAESHNDLGKFPSEYPREEIGKIYAISE